MQGREPTSYAPEGAYLRYHTKIPRWLREFLVSKRPISVPIRGYWDRYLRYLLDRHERKLLTRPLPDVRHLLHYEDEMAGMGFYDAENKRRLLRLRERLQTHIREILMALLYYEFEELRREGDDGTQDS